MVWSPALFFCIWISSFLSTICQKVDSISFYSISNFTYTAWFDLSNSHTRQIQWVFYFSILKCISLLLRDWDAKSLVQVTQAEQGLSLWTALCSSVLLNHAFSEFSTWVWEWKAIFEVKEGRYIKLKSHS